MSMRHLLFSKTQTEGHIFTKSCSCWEQRVMTSDWRLYPVGQRSKPLLAQKGL